MGQGWLLGLVFPGREPPSAGQLRVVSDDIAPPGTSATLTLPRIHGDLAGARVTDLIDEAHPPDHGLPARRLPARGRHPLGETDDALAVRVVDTFYAPSMPPSP